MLHAVSVHALAFDVFGTVVDWRSSIVEEARAVGARHGLERDWGAFADRWRERYQPSLEQVRSGARPWTYLDRLHRESLQELVTEFRLEAISESELDHLNRAWHRLSPWPDSREGLRRLRERFTLTTLSNGNVGLLVDLVREGDLPFHCVLSAELCEAYKPDPRTYRMVPSLLQLAPGEVMMVAAHRADLRAAAGQGLATAYIRRPREWGSATVVPDPDPGFDAVANDLVDLAGRL